MVAVDADAVGEQVRRGGCGGQGLSRAGGVAAAREHARQGVQGVQGQGLDLDVVRRAGGGDGRGEPVRVGVQRGQDVPREGQPVAAAGRVVPAV